MGSIAPGINGGLGTYREAAGAGWGHRGKWEAFDAGRTSGPRMLSCVHAVSDGVVTGLIIDNANHCSAGTS